MKKITLLFLLAIIAGSAYSQELRVNTYAGYVFDDKIDSYFSNTSYYEGKILGGFRWGAGVEYLLPNTTRALELQYLRQDTSAPTVYQDGGILNGQIQNTEFDLAANWILLNATNYFPVSEKIEPFFGAGIGMVISKITNPDNGNSNSATKFAWNIRGGSNFWLSERVGIRVQASLMSAVQGAGGGLYFGTGGVSTGVSTYSSIYQFGFDGGVVLSFPQ